MQKTRRWFKQLPISTEVDITVSSRTKLNETTRNGLIQRFLPSLSCLGAMGLAIPNSFEINIWAFML